MDKSVFHAFKTPLNHHVYAQQMRPIFLKITHKSFFVEQFSSPVMNIFLHACIFLFFPPCMKQWSRCVFFFHFTVTPAPVFTGDSFSPPAMKLCIQMDLFSAVYVMWRPVPVGCGCCWQARLHPFCCSRSFFVLATPWTLRPVEIMARGMWPWHCAHTCSHTHGTHDTHQQYMRGWHTINTLSFFKILH